MKTTKSKIREPKLAHGEEVFRELTAAELEEVRGALLNSAFNATIKAIGEGLSTMARKG
jgi:hypothetical protein